MKLPRRLWPGRAPAGSALPVSTPILSRPEPFRIIAVVGRGAALVVPLEVMFCCGCSSSSSLSGRSGESWTAARGAGTLIAAAAALFEAVLRIVLGTRFCLGRGEGVSSSLESTKRLRNAGRLSSSSLESSKRLPPFDFLPFAERPNPESMREDPVSLGSARSDDRIRPLIATGGGELVLELRRKADPVGDRDRRLNRLLALALSGGCGVVAGSRVVPRIVLRKPVPSPPVFARRKLLSLESEPLRERAGFGAFRIVVPLSSECEVGRAPFLNVDAIFCPLAAEPLPLSDLRMPVPSTTSARAAVAASGSGRRDLRNVPLCSDCSGDATAEPRIDFRSFAPPVDFGLSCVEAFTRGFSTPSRGQVVPG
ncbi:hypothetical protein HG530_002427 [Fusarium avenaceum]|nr:hypothetical protein HG530_002427 [Fusarium avenaceum]